MVVADNLAYEMGVPLRAFYYCLYLAAENFYLTVAFSYTQSNGYNILDILNFAEYGFFPIC